MTPVRLKHDVILPSGAVFEARADWFWIAEEYETSDGVRFRLCDWRGTIVMQVKPEMVEPVEVSRAV